MFCPKCGVEIPDQYLSFIKSTAQAKEMTGNVFCPKCGVEIPEEYLLAYSASVTHAKESSEPQRYEASARPDAPSAALTQAALKSHTAAARPVAPTDVKPIVRGDMLTCPVCSQQHISPLATSCPQCHTGFIPYRWTCPACKGLNLYATAHCQGCGGPFSLRGPADSGQASYRNSTLGKKWFHFQIYFALFAGAIVNIISGLTMIETSPFAAVMSIVLGVFLFFVRSFLATFKSYGPSSYLSTRLISACVSIFTSLTELSALKSTTDYYSSYHYRSSVADSVYDGAVTGVVISVVLQFIILICEWVYFSKRSSWFKK